MEDMLAVVRGRVERGNRIGRTLGFPTANIAVCGDSPQDGVYVAEAKVEGKLFRAVADLGYRPSVDEGTECRRLEVHLLDFEDDIYGSEIEVRLLHRLRPELRFDSMEELREQIEADTAAARTWFEQRVINGN